MDYTGKLLKGLYEAIELLKDIKAQNKEILRHARSIRIIEEKSHNYFIKDEVDAEMGGND